jgi:hypothetical protein
MRKCVPKDPRDRQRMLGMARSDRRLDAFAVRVMGTALRSVRADPRPGLRRRRELTVSGTQKPPGSRTGLRTYGQ